MFNKRTTEELKKVAEILTEELQIHDSRLEEERQFRQRIGDTSPVGFWEFADVKPGYRASIIRKEQLCLKHVMQWALAQRERLTSGATSS